MAEQADTTKTALVTGASAGLGAEFARQLAQRRYDLVLVARRQERLVSLAEDLRGQGRQVRHFARDLSEPGAAEKLHEEVTREGLRVDLVVNNAGSGTLGDVVDTSLADIHAQIAVNVIALTGLSRLFAADFVGRGQGTILNVASLAALLPAPHMAVYGATKAYVHSFTEALAAELAGSSARAVVLDPGPTRTEFFDASGGRIGPDAGFASPEQVVRAALGALDRARTPLVVTPGRGNALAAPLIRRMPRRLGLALSERMNRMGLELAARSSTSG